MEAAVKDSGVEPIVERVTDKSVMIGFGVMTPPALVIDGEVKAAGRVLVPEEILSARRPHSPVEHPILALVGWPNRRIAIEWLAHEPRA